MALIIKRENLCEELRKCLSHSKLPVKGGCPYLSCIFRKASYLRRKVVIFKVIKEGGYIQECFQSLGSPISRQDQSINWKHKILTSSEWETALLCLALLWLSRRQKKSDWRAGTASGGPCSSLGYTITQLSEVLFLSGPQFPFVKWGMWSWWSLTVLWAINQNF